jgi:hypothetical protein
MAKKRSQLSIVAIYILSFQTIQLGIIGRHDTYYEFWQEADLCRGWFQYRPSGGT